MRGRCSDCWASPWHHSPGWSAHSGQRNADDTVLWVPCADAALTRCAASPVVQGEGGVKASEPVTNLGRAHGDDRAVKGWIVGKKELAAHEPPKRFVMAGVIIVLA